MDENNSLSPSTKKPRLYTIQDELVDLRQQHQGLLNDEYSFLENELKAIGRTTDYIATVERLSGQLETFGMASTSLTNRIKSLQDIWQHQQIVSRELNQILPLIKIEAIETLEKEVRSLSVHDMVPYFRSRINALKKKQLRGNEKKEADVSNNVALSVVTSLQHEANAHSSASSQNIEVNASSAENTGDNSTEITVTEDSADDPLIEDEQPVNSNNPLELQLNRLAQYQAMQDCPLHYKFMQKLYQTSGLMKLYQQQLTITTDLILSLWEQVKQRFSVHQRSNDTSVSDVHSNSCHNTHNSSSEEQQQQTKDMTQTRKLLKQKKKELKKKMNEERRMLQKCCTFFIVRKNRYCSMTVVRDKQYCAQHLVADDKPNEDGLVRIPCPLDPNHSVYKHQLQQHLTVCNAREPSHLPYYSKNRNCGAINETTFLQHTTPSYKSLQHAGKGDAFLQHTQQDGASLRHTEQQDGASLQYNTENDLNVKAHNDGSKAAKLHSLSQKYIVHSEDRVVEGNSSELKDDSLLVKDDVELQPCLDGTVARRDAGLSDPYPGSKEGSCSSPKLGLNGRSLAELSDQELMALIRRVLTAEEEETESIAMEELSHASMAGELENSECVCRPNMRRHLLQNSSLVAHLDNIGAFVAPRQAHIQQTKHNWNKTDKKQQTPHQNSLQDTNPQQDNTLQSGKEQNKDELNKVSSKKREKCTNNAHKNIKTAEDCSCELQYEDSMKYEVQQSADISPSDDDTYVPPSDDDVSNTEQSCFLEFGAGRGQLSHWVANAWPESHRLQMLLIDRGAQRYKFDSRIREMRRSHVATVRLRVDIADLALEQVPDVQLAGHVFAGGKHLCGAATDLALRCLQNSKVLCGWQESSSKAETSISSSMVETSSSSRKMETSSSSRRCGLVIALCCHHRCCWQHYTGKAFFQNVGFDEEDFPAILGLSSWAVCAAREAKADAGASSNSTTAPPNSTTAADASSNSTTAADSKNALSSFGENNSASSYSDTKPYSSSSSEGSGCDTASSKPDTEPNALEGAAAGYSSGRTNSKQKAKERSTSSSSSDHEVVSEEPHVRNRYVRLGLSIAERERIGRSAKHLVNHGRVLHLRSLGLQARLVYYVHSHTTLENVALIAHN